MWECQKCHERREDSFDVCWKCGTSKSGVEDPGFRPADEVDAASLVDRTEETAIIVGPPRSAIASDLEYAYHFSPALSDRFTEKILASLSSFWHDRISCL